MRSERLLKDALVTIRMSIEERGALDYLCDSLDKSISDTILRAYKFLLGMGITKPISDSDDRKIRKTCYVHVRMSSDDKARIEAYGMQTGESVSQVLRRAIMLYSDSFTYRY